MIIQIILGAILTYAGFYGGNKYSPVLFVEGLILINLAIANRHKAKGLSHL
jgi:hypothetical protein